MRASVCLTRQFCILIHRQNWGAAFSMVEPASVTFWRYGSWWRRDTRQRGLETQVLRAKYRGPETQVLKAKCSNTRVVKTRRQQQKKRAVSVYRGPETQVLRAKCSNTRHGRIVSDRHGYPLVQINSKKTLKYSNWGPRLGLVFGTCNAGGLG